MRAAVLRKPGPLQGNPLAIEDVPVPSPAQGEALLKVLACGVCRTDLHIAAGELPQKMQALIPGHQIVAAVLESPSTEFPAGTRVGVSWVGGTDGTCRYCRSARENLCDAADFALAWQEDEDRAVFACKHVERDARDLVLDARAWVATDISRCNGEGPALAFN